jgi:hypothetical protein
MKNAESENEPSFWDGLASVLWVAAIAMTVMGVFSPTGITSEETLLTAIALGVLSIGIRS